MVAGNQTSLEEPFPPIKLIGHKSNRLTCLGIDNTGDYVFSYGKEDTDYYVDGDPSSDYVFRVADSVFFCRLRDLFPTEMQAMFKDREEKGAWNSNSLITQWDNSQAKFCEELWRLDYERKYYRTYLGLSIDNSIAKGVDKTFLIGKFFGRKKYARRAFEINQEMYFATKYFGNKALSDVIWIRGNVPIGGNIKPNYSLTLVPYSDMYVPVQYTSTGTPIHKKVKAGQTCIFESDAERLDFIYVYAASFIQEVGDLSRCFVGDNNFSAGTRLQKLVLGSTDDGYENTFMTNVLVENNPLLEYLDLRNISGINTDINVSGCSNLKELYAEGTNATGVIFANGGLLETAHLPSIASLSMKNLNYIKDFSVDSYANLQTLIVENTPGVNTYTIVNEAPLLKLVRLINLNWDSSYQITDGTIFNRLLTLDGIDSSGYETDLSILTGSANVSVIGQKDLYNYQNAWNELTIIPATTIPQYTVTFKNDDGTVLDVQYINQFEDAVDPVTREDNPIEIPTKEKDIQYEYTYAGWGNSLSNITSDRIITAIYTESLRMYTARYVSMGITVYEETGYYGDNIICDEIPQYTNEEPYKFYLFNRWKKSGFLTSDFDENGIKIIDAIYDEFIYTDGIFANKELSDMKPVEIYAMNKLGLYKDIITDKDSYSFTFGHDFNYDDIESVNIIEDTMSFDGTNYYDTGIQLFDEDKDFVLAIDFKFTGDTANSVLTQCYQGSGTVGFKLQYNNGVQLKWGANASSVSNVDKREMIVIRHKKGDTNLYIYSSNLDNDEVLISTLASKAFTSESTLVFGCEKQTSTIFANYATGKIYWAKLWYADLGEDVCKQLALWPHETVSLEACGFNKYYLSNNPDEMCSFSLLASYLLDRTRKWNTTGTNDGGWAGSTLNEYLNNRLYNALPTQIKSLIKQVDIKSSDGIQSSTGSQYTDVTNSGCYIAIPSLAEVQSRTDEPYISEGTLISYFNLDTTRQRAFNGGDYSSYWLRSPSIDWANYVWTVNENGETDSINTATDSLGVLILLSF